MGRGIPSQNSKPAHPGETPAFYRKTATDTTDEVAATGFLFRKYFIAKGIRWSQRSRPSRLPQTFVQDLRQWLKLCSPHFILGPSKDCFSDAVPHPGPRLRVRSTPTRKAGTMLHDDSSGALDDSPSSGSIYREFQGSEVEFNDFFSRVMNKFHRDLEDYLFHRGATRLESEEVVQDFFVKQFQKRTAFARLHYWMNVSRTPQRAFGFLKACVIHHLIDIRRKQHPEQFVQELRESTPYEKSFSQPKLDPVDYAWAVSVLQVAIHDLKAALIDDQPRPDSSDKKVPTRHDRDSRLLTWQVFVEKFISPSVRHVVRGRKFNTNEIAARLGLTRDQVLYRVQQVRELFACHLRQALADSCPDIDPEVLFHDLRTTLVLGNVSLPDLLTDLPDFFAESTLDTFNIFSLATPDDLPHDEVIDLLIPPTPDPDEQETRELWALLMRREFQPHPGTQSGTNRSRPKSVEEIIFAPSPSCDDLQTIKKLAKENGQRDHRLLQEVYHAIYALVIARAKNALGLTITSWPADRRASSLAFAARYPWLPEQVSREIEIAIRKFSEPDDQSNLAP
jgi:DNA-directed RNA polymerase specialized sigma24 family protein